MDDQKPIFNVKLSFFAFGIHKPNFKRCNYFIVNVHHAHRTMITSLVVVKEAPDSFMTASAMKI